MIPAAIIVAFPIFFVDRKGVSYVFRVSNNFKVPYSVVASIKVFVVDLEGVWDRSIKCLPHEPVSGISFWPAVNAQKNILIKVSSGQCFYGPISGISIPCNSLSDLPCGSITNADYGSHGHKGSAFGQKLFSQLRLLWSEDFAATYTAKLADIRYFIEALKPQNWLPYFHKSSLFNKYSTNGGQY